MLRTWKQPGCPSTDEGIQKLRYMYTIEYHSAIKKNAFVSVLMRWMNLEPIIQGEVCQRKINVIYQCIHMESRKMVLMKLFAGQQWRPRHREQTYGHVGERKERVRCMERVTWKLTLSYGKQIVSGNVLCD